MANVRTVIVALVCVALAGGDARAGRGEAQVHYKKGMAAYALEDWDGAIAEFQAGFREEPMPAFLFNIAQSHRSAGRRGEAIRFYERYLELAPEAADRGEVEERIRELKKSQAAAAATPAAGPRPAASQAAAPRKPDAAGIALVVTGSLLVAAGAGLAVWGVVLDAKATDRTSRLDLGQRQDLESRSSAVGIAGYTGLGVGAALIIGGAVRLALAGKKGPVTVGLSAAPGSALATLGGAF